MPRLRFVNKLSEEIKRQLGEIYRDHADFAFRQRAHAILLSDKGFTINQLQDIFEVDRDTVSAWIGLFEQSGVDGLKPLPRPGRPPIYNEDEVRQFKDLVDQEPRQIKQAQAALQHATGKSSCTEELKRALKKARLLVAPLPPLAERPTRPRRLRKGKAKPARLAKAGG
jgi:transposase